MRKCDHVATSEVEIIYLTKELWKQYTQSRKRKRSKWKHSYGRKTSWHEKGQSNAWAKIHKNKLTQWEKKVAEAKSCSSFAFSVEMDPLWSTQEDNLATGTQQKTRLLPASAETEQFDKTWVKNLAGDGWGGGGGENGGNCTWTIKKNDTHKKSKWLWHSALGQVGKKTC